MNVLNVVLIFEILVIIIDSVVSVDFCDAFRRQENRISYLYKQGLRKGDYVTQTIHVIIDGQYWDFLFNTHTHNVEFNASVSQSAPIFTDDYMAAVCLWRGGENGKCDTLLLPRKGHRGKVNVTRIDNNDHKGVKPLNQFSTPEEWTVNGLPDFEYVLADGGHEKFKDKARVDFAVGRVPGRSLSRMFYDFEEVANYRFNVTEVSSDYTSKSKSFQMDKEVIGICYQWSNDIKDFGHIVLMRDRQVVYWCWRDVEDTGCDSKQLINCTAVKPTDGPFTGTQSAPDGPDDDYPEPEPGFDKQLVVIVSVGALFLLLIISCFLIYIIYRHRKQQLMTSMSSTLSANTSTTKAASKKSSDAKTKWSSAFRASPKGRSVAPKTPPNKAKTSLSSSKTPNKPSTKVYSKAPSTASMAPTKTATTVQTTNTSTVPKKNRQITPKK